MTTATTAPGPGPAALRFLELSGSDELIRSCLPQIERLIRQSNGIQSELIDESPASPLPKAFPARVTRDIPSPDHAPGRAELRGNEVEIRQETAKPARPAPTRDRIVERLSEKLRKHGDEIEVSAIATTTSEREMLRAELEGHSEYEYLAGNRWGPARVRLAGGPESAPPPPPVAPSPSPRGRPPAKPITVARKFGRPDPLPGLIDAEKAEATELLLRVLPDVGDQLEVEMEVPARLQRAARYIGLYDTRFSSHDDADNNRVIKRVAIAGGIKKGAAA